MYERTRSSSSSGYHTGYYSNAAAKMNDIGPRKTLFVLVVVVGCFAILWPKVFYPMLVGSANQHMKPSPIDKTTGCCDVFSETDINTIKIMSELCSDIIQQSAEKPLSGKEIVARCKNEVQQTCGIDIGAVLQEQIKLGRTVKQILNEIRSLNGSLCLKYHYGVAPWRLGVPHRIAVNVTSHVRQERPPHMRPDVIHPAFRERGSAIPRVGGGSKKPQKIVEGRPGPIPGMRPTLGGAGHVVPPSQKTGSSMSVIMPIYTIGIVIFFTYTLMKLLFKKQPDGVGGSLYPPVEPDPRFRREVFESERCRYTPRLSRDPTGKIVVNAMSALLDEVDGELEARRKNNLFVNQRPAAQEQTSVKILGMETTASCEGGERWTRRVEPMIAIPHTIVEEKTPAPQEIYLQGSLPAQSQILVSDSAIVTEPGQYDVNNSDPAVVLAGKMTLSVISLDGEKSNEPQTIPSISVQTPEMVDFNGDTENNTEDIVDESKYTTASSATAAERDISEDEEGTDNEIGDDIEKINDLELEINHTPQVSNGVDVEEEIAKACEEYTEEIVEQVVDEIEEIVLVEENGGETTPQRLDDAIEKGGKAHSDEEEITSKVDHEELLAEEVEKQASTSKVDEELLVEELMKTVEDQDTIKKESQVKLDTSKMDGSTGDKIDDLVKVENDEIIEEIKDVEVVERINENLQKEISEATKLAEESLEQRIEEEKNDGVGIVENTSEDLQEEIAQKEKPIVPEEVEEIPAARIEEDLPKSFKTVEETIDESSKIEEESKNDVEEEVKIEDIPERIEEESLKKSPESITSIEENTDRNQSTKIEEEKPKESSIKDVKGASEVVQRIEETKIEQTRPDESGRSEEIEEQHVIETKTKANQSDKVGKPRGEAPTKKSEETSEGKVIKDVRNDDEAVEDDGDEEIEEEEEVEEIEEEEVEEEEEIEEEIEEIEVTDDEEIEEIENGVNGQETEE